ncbi:hypothetical protein [Sorangium sp. So ce385]|uniref:hypothetical protein n=1 Tax=Sorangium sp. So ce385 TaxID=3133308 RepID=UPI003F5B09D6
MGFILPAFYLRLHGNPAEALGLIDEALLIERAARWAQGNGEPTDLAPEVITNAYFRQ